MLETFASQSLLPRRRWTWSETAHIRLSQQRRGFALATCSQSTVSCIRSLRGCSVTFCALADDRVVDWYDIISLSRTTAQCAFKNNHTTHNLGIMAKISVMPVNGRIATLGRYAILITAVSP